MFLSDLRAKLKEVAALQFWKLPAFRPPLPVPAQYSPVRSLSLGLFHIFPFKRGERGFSPFEKGRRGGFKGDSR
jgi:hypothetical protein